MQILPKLRLLLDLNQENLVQTFAQYKQKYNKISKQPNDFKEFNSLNFHISESSVYHSSFASKPHTPCFTLIEQALSAFLTLIMFNEPWILPDVVYVIDFTFFHEGEYDS